MLYLYQELLDWLKSHALINISQLEVEANVPKDTIRHFIKDRRDISSLHYESIKDVLYKYGFNPLLVS